VRAFCKNCGSNMPVLEDEGAHVVVPAGLLDDDPHIRPIVHIHTASKAPWSTSRTHCHSSRRFRPSRSGFNTNSIPVEPLSDPSLQPTCCGLRPPHAAEPEH
jgi:hypothetical protein